MTLLFLAPLNAGVMTVMNGKRRFVRLYLGR